MLRTIIVTALVAVSASAPFVDPPAPVTLAGADQRVSVAYGDVSGAMWDGLIARGYTGDPRDHREALYPRRDDALAECRTDADCWYAATAGAIIR